MSKTLHSVKLFGYSSVDLDRISYSGGDVVYDKTNGTLRVMNGETPGGSKLATQTWVQTSAGTITANLKGDIYTASGARVLDNGTTLANPAFFGDIYASNGTSKILDNGTDGTNAAFTGSVTGNLTGNVTGNLTGNVTGNVTGDLTGNVTATTLSGALTGNVTGNVTGNLTGAVTGNADTATILKTTRTINSVNFNGSASITLSTLVNGAKTVTLDSSGNLTAPGNFTTSTGTVNANTVTVTTSVSADTVTTANDVTVGGNAVISTAPTLITHATNKKYVDKRATAMAIALS
jgi:hypothetical protein